MFLSRKIFLYNHFQKIFPKTKLIIHLQHLSKRFSQHEYELPITIPITSDFKIQKNSLKHSNFLLTRKLNLQEQTLHNYQDLLKRGDFPKQTNSQTRGLVIKGVRSSLLEQKTDSTEKHGGLCFFLQRPSPQKTKFLLIRFSQVYLILINLKLNFQPCLNKTELWNLILHLVDQDALP
jgi:hypothetical protein